MRKTSLRIMALFITLLINVSLFAQTNTNRVLTGQWDLQQQDKPFTMPVERKKLTPAADENVFNLRFIITDSTDDPKEWTGLVLVTGDEGTEVCYTEDGSSAECRIPSGTYDVSTNGWLLYPANTKYDSSGFIIAKKITVFSDTTIIIDIAEAKNKVTIKHLDAVGQEVSLPTYNGYQLTEGSAKNIDDYFHLCDKDRGEIINLARQKTYNFSGVEKFGLYTNDLDENYTLTVCSFYRTNDGKCYIYKSVVENEQKDSQISVSPNQFYQYEETFMPNPLQKESSGFGLLSIGIERCVGENALGWIPWETYDNNLIDNKLTLYMDLPLHKKKDVFDFFVRTGINDGQEMVINSMPYFDEYGMPAFDENGQLVMVNDTTYNLLKTFGPAMAMGNNGIEYFVDNTFGIDVYGHPALNFTEKEKGILYGGNVPIAYMLCTDWFGNIAVDYLGRLGEKREADNEVYKAVIRYEGNTYEGSLKSMYDNIYSLTSFDVIDIDIVNTNIIVDDLQGMNKTSVHFGMSNNDWAMPTLSALRFKNMDGLITDRFDTATGVSFEMTCGDFVFNPDALVYWDCSGDKPMVEVSYAPHRSEAFITLDTEDIPENFHMPGFGYFYRGSLADVQGEAEKGWFDLKIRLTDAAGNWQEQVISPAFRIDDCVATGISETVKPTVPAAKTYFSLDGKRSVTPQKGLNIVRQADGTVRKVTVR